MSTDNGKITRIYWFYANNDWGHIVWKNSSAVCEYAPVDNTLSSCLIEMLLFVADKSQVSIHLND